MDASLCGVLRAFFADFLSLLSGMKLSVPLSTTFSTCLADMINLLLGLGCRAHLAPAPLPVGETGVARARAVGAEGDRPACTSGLRLWKPFRLCRPRGRSGRPPGRSRIFRDFTLARARAEPLAPNRKRASVPQRSGGQSAVARPVKKAPAGGSA